MGQPKNRKSRCSLCLSPNEEDLLLVTRLIFSTAPSLCIWGNSGIAVMKEVAKLTNFKKLVSEVLGATHSDIQTCDHSSLVEVIPKFLAKFSMDEKQTATVPDFIDLNKAFKATWIDVVNVKSSLYEIESRIAILHKNLLEKQIEGSKQDRGDPPAASSLVKRPPDVEPNSSLERDLHAAKKKSRFSKDTSKILKDWLAENSNNPYPNFKTKVYLSKSTGLSLCQVQNWFINARKRSVITAEPLEPRVTEWNDRVEENTKDAKERHLQSNVGPFNGKTSPFIPRKDCEPVFMLQSNLATTERSEEGSSVNELKTLISLPKRQYDNIDISEAIVLDDLDNFQSREDPRRSPNYYAIYLNNAYRLLSQDGNHKQLKNEDILPASDLRKSNPIDKNN